MSGTIRQVAAAKLRRAYALCLARESYDLGRFLHQDESGLDPDLDHEAWYRATQMLSAAWRENWSERLHYIREYQAQLAEGYKLPSQSSRFNDLVQEALALLEEV